MTTKPALRVGIGGPVGSGKTALVRTLCERLYPYYDLAVITAAKALASTVVDLLADGGAQGGKIVSSHRPDMTGSEYLAFMRKLASEELFDYEEVP